MKSGHGVGYRYFVLMLVLRRSPEIRTQRLENQDPRVIALSLVVMCQGGKLVTPFGIRLAVDLA